jgi:predicted ATPase/class 3 adenylate cyclase
MVVCPQCGEENTDRAKFCSECATPLAAAASVERRERRVVSVLFADLVGFTRRSEDLDVEDVEGFLAPYQAVLGGCVERTGGVVAKFTGDGVMAVFGGRVAHEDDAERAVRCALAIRDGLAEVERGGGEGRLRVRVGITTGEALVSLGAGGSVDAVGDVVNTAARLESAAPMDGVLVDEWTFRATDRVIRYEQAEPVEAKGKSEAVLVWMAVEPRSIVPEQARELLELVGRDDEAEALRGALDRSMREPSTQLVSVIGEPGIGKSRLVEELLAYVEGLPGLVTWRRGRSLSYGEGVAFWALGEMVKGQAGILESDSAQVAQEKLAEAVAGVILDERDRAGVAQHLGPLVGLEAATSAGEGGRVEAFAAWRRFFEALAEDGPTVLVFEDIHWADDALLDFIDLIADRAGAVPLLIVCTARPELFERRTGWAGGKTNATTISLTPLSDEDTAKLVGGLLDQALLPAEVQRALLERAEGNPLYAQEYVRMLQDRGILTKQAGGWVLKGEIVDLPESIQGIIAARLDTLTPDEKMLLQDASVIGKTGWIGAVCALTERASWEADELLHSLERKQLLQRIRRSSIHGETEFQFGHSLTRDVAYSQIRRSDRAAKHLAAAGWIEKLAGQRDDKAELLADHYTQALTLREAMGEDTTALAAKASVAYTEAGDQAAATYAYPVASRHYQAALTLTPPDDTKAHAMLLLGQATALSNADTPDQAILDDALNAQVAAGQWEAAAEVELMLSYWYERHAEAGEEADAHLARGAEYAARIPPSTTMCRIADQQAYRLATSGRAEQALALTSEMIPRAEQAELDVGRALLLERRGYARLMLGDTNGAADMRDAADTLARNTQQRTPAAYSNLADAMRGLGAMAAADAAYTTAAEWARRLARTYLIDWVALEQGYQAYHAADWATSQQRLSQVTATTNQLTENLVRIVRGRISLAHDCATDALTNATNLIGSATSTGSDEDLYYGLALEARCHHAEGRDTDALQACDRFLTRWHETGGYTYRAIELCEITPILAISDRHQHIHDAAMLLPQACRWRDALLLVADQQYAEAAALYTQIGSHPLATDTHLLAAHKAASEGRAADAAHHAQAVLTFAEQTGATLYQRQAEQSLRATA